MIGYPSGQDGAILPAWDYPLYPASKISQSHMMNDDDEGLYFFISFVDQVCSVKMAGYWPSSFLRVYGPRLRLGP